jgi:hypothetical protein
MLESMTGSDTVGTTSSSPAILVCICKFADDLLNWGARCAARGALNGDNTHRGIAAALQ